MRLLLMNKWLDSTVKTYIDNFGKARDPIVYDVGSRDGHDGVELAERIYDGINLWRDGQIVLFECNPPQQEKIRRIYPDATLVTEAISNKKGTVDFMQIHGDNNMVGSSTMNTKRDDGWIKKTTTIKVPARRLDDIIEELGHQDKEIDIMKIDIEGFTYEALESLGKYLRNVRVFHLETEIEGYARNKTNLDIALFMQEKGYLCKALEGEWLPLIQDAVYVRQ
jgi:FkbM family methyltransferase